MIRRRRTPPLAVSTSPRAAVGTLPSGAFGIYFGGAQVSGTVDAGSILRGTTATVTIRVQNDGLGDLAWTNYTISGTSSTWYTNTDGGAITLAPGDFQDLVFRFTVPAATTAGTYSTTFTFQATATPTYEVAFTLSHGVFEEQPEPELEPPVAPTGIVATATDGGFTVLWTGAQGATTYLVRIATVSGGPYSLAEQQVATTSATFTGRTNGVTLYGVVYSQNAITGTSGPSTEFTVTPTKPPEPDPDPSLDAPTITSVSVGQTFCVPRWTAVATADTYYVRVYTTGGTLVADVATTALTALVTGLMASTAYDVKVSATDDALGIESPESAAYRITTLASSGGPGSPALPRADTMTVYGHFNAGITPTFAPTGNIRKTPTIRVSGSVSMKSLGQLLGQAAALEPEDHRSVMIQHIGTGRTDLADISTGQTPYSFVESQGYALDSVWAEAMLEFWEGFGDVDPVLIALDEEQYGADFQAVLLPTWDFLGPDGPSRAAQFAPIYADATLLARLPLALRKSSVEELSLIDNRYTHPNSYLAGVWDSYCYKQRAKDLREIVVDTYEQIWGRRPRYFNYDDHRSTRAHVGSFGLPMPAGDFSMGTISALPLYLAEYSNPYFFLGDSYRAEIGLEPLQKAQRWNLFISYLNRARACKTGAIPHLHRLRYNGGDTLADDTANPQNAVELMKHLAAMGIREHAWFCPGVDQEDVAEYQSIVERVEVLSAPTRRLPVIPYDADSVTTNGVTTTYDEYAWTAGGTYDPVEV